MYAIRNRAGALLVVLVLAVSGGCSSDETATGQRVFDAPESAADELVDALERDDVDAFREIFGPEYAGEFVTPAWADELEARQQIASAAREKLELAEADGGAVDFGADTRGIPRGRADPGPGLQDTGRRDTEAASDGA